MKFEKGNIIKNISVVGTRIMRVVDVFDFEPKMLLATEVENDGLGTCFMILQIDSTVLEQGEAPNQQFKRRPDTAKELPNYIVASDERTS